MVEGVDIRLDGLRFGESLLLCPEIIYKAIEKVRIIRDRLKTAYSRLKFVLITEEEIFSLK